MPITELYDWVAYFQFKKEEQERANDEARNKAKQNSGRGRHNASI